MASKRTPTTATTERAKLRAARRAAVDVPMAAAREQQPAALPMLQRISSLRDLTALAVYHPRFERLAIIAAQNLGGRVDAGHGAFDQAMNWLRVNAQETSERGVVAEVNAVRDLERGETNKLRRQCSRVGAFVRLLDRPRVDVIGRVLRCEANVLGAVVTVRVPNWTADGMPVDFTAQVEQLEPSTKAAMIDAAQAR